MIAPRERRLGFGLAALVLLGSSCRGAPSATTEVEFWALGREGEVVQRMIPQFERRHPELRVRVQQIPWSAAHEKLLTAFVGEAMPDVFQAGNTWIPEFVALGAIEPLNDRLARSSATAPDDYFGGILDTNVIDGSAYAIPWYVDTRLIFYRTDILASAGYPAPPRTWKAWVDAMTRVKQRAAPGEFAILQPVNEWQPLVVLALQLGAELLREDETQGNFRSPPFRQAFAFYVDLFRRGLAPLASQAEVANLYQEFGRGAFAFYVTGPWNIGQFRERLPAALEGKWATAPLPSPDERYPGVSLAGGASLAIFRGSPRKEAAWKLIEYLSDPAQELELYRMTGDLPARKTAWTNEGPAGDPHARAFWAQLEHVRSTPKIPEWERIAARIARYSEATIRGQLDVDEALAALDRDVDNLLEKRRWMIRTREHRSS
jgi:multiple sugar transport system substrate-binding protein